LSLYVVLSIFMSLSFF